MLILPERLGERLAEMLVKRPATLAGKNSSIEWGELLARGDENTATVPMDAMAPRSHSLHIRDDRQSERLCLYAHRACDQDAV